MSVGIKVCVGSGWKEDEKGLVRRIGEAAVGEIGLSIQRNDDGGWILDENNNWWTRIDFVEDGSAVVSIAYRYEDVDHPTILQALNGLKIFLEWSLG